MIQNYTRSPYTFSHRLKESSTTESGLCKKKNETTSAPNYEYIKREPEKNVNFCGLFNSKTNAEKDAAKAAKKAARDKANEATAKKICTYLNRPFGKKILEFAERNQLVFGASFALILTCILRPGAIMVSPSKKNKGDQKYAAAHSMASGVIGFAIANVIFTPLSNGINKVKDALKKNPEELIKNKTSYLLKNERARETGTTLIERFPDVALAIPKAALTVALIPPILKCFGWEKKKIEKMPPKTDFTLLNFKSTNQTTPTEVVGGTK